MFPFRQTINHERREEEGAVLTQLSGQMYDKNPLSSRSDSIAKRTLLLLFKKGIAE